MGSKDPIRLVTSVGGQLIAKLESLPEKPAVKEPDEVNKAKNIMQINRQFALLDHIRNKLILHFSIPNKYQKDYFLAQDKEKTCWMLYADWECTITFDDPDGPPCISFDMRVAPDMVASTMYCLLKNWIDVRVMECYFVDDEGDMFWGEEAENKYKTFCKGDNDQK